MLSVEVNTCSNSGCCLVFGGSSLNREGVLGAFPADIYLVTHHHLQSLLDPTTPSAAITPSLHSSRANDVEQIPHARLLKRPGPTRWRTLWRFVSCYITDTTCSASEQNIIPYTLYRQIQAADTLRVCAQIPSPCPARPVVAIFLRVVAIAAFELL